VPPAHHGGTTTTAHRGCWLVHWLVAGTGTSTQYQCQYQGISPQFPGVLRARCSLLIGRWALDSPTPTFAGFASAIKCHQKSTSNIQLG
jgi:hypothetical protein